MGQVLKGNGVKKNKAKRPEYKPITIEFRKFGPILEPLPADDPMFDFVTRNMKEVMAVHLMEQGDIEGAKDVIEHGVDFNIGGADGTLHEFADTPSEIDGQGKPGSSKPSNHKR